MKRLTVILGILAIVASGEAAIVAGWDVNGVDVGDGTGLDAPGAPYAFSATTSETTYVTAQLTLGEEVNPSTSSGQFGFKIPSAEATNTLAGAIASDHYIDFTLSVSSGYALNLGSIEMNGGGSSTACSNIVLMCSVDGFVAGQEIASAYPANGTGGFDTDSSGFGSPIDLSGSQYSNLTGSVSFRLYGWNSSSGSGTTFLRNLSGEDLLVYGNVVEFSSTANPILSMATSNGATRISVVFDGANTTDYILEHATDLTELNGWDTLSDPFASNIVWQIETTNTAGFYRAVPD